MADLRGSEAGLQLLTAQQRVGLRYHEELQQRIPREEVAAGACTRPLVSST